MNDNSAEDMMTELIRKTMESTTHTDLRTIRLYHMYHPNIKEMSFDTALSPAGLAEYEKMGTPVAPSQRAMIPGNVGNITVDDAKKLIEILTVFVNEVEFSND